MEFISELYPSPNHLTLSLPSLGMAELSPNYASLLTQGAWDHIYAGSIFVFYHMPWFLTCGGYLLDVQIIKK